MSGPRYQLAARSTGTALFGLSVPQVTLVGVGVAVAAALIRAGGLSVGGAVSVAVVLGATLGLAFGRWNGRPIYESVPVVARFGGRAVADQNLWFAPVPVSSVDGQAIGEAKLPRCLEGLEIRSVPRPDWAGSERSLTPMGLCVDRRSGTVTGVVSVKGSEFQLVADDDQHRRIFGWGRVLAQFAREAAPVARICWHEWSCPAPLSEHLAWLAEHSDPAAAAAPAYRDMIAGQTIQVARHELRVTITVDPKRVASGRSGRRAKRDAVTTALGLVKELTQRCRAEHLIVSPPLSPADIAEAVRVQGHPPAISSRPRTRGLGERAGLVPAAYGPLAMDASWDAVVVDGTWHRSFWVSAWPTMEVGPNWMEPLLLNTRGTRTVTVIMEPVNPRSSHRHVTKDSVGIDATIHTRDSKGFRVPVELRRAKDDVDRREIELAAGFAEYHYLALLDVAAASLGELDDLSADYLNVAAQCGIELRSLDGRHDAAWACTLPVGRAPDRDLIGGMTA
jgi:hypothetical protein